MAIKTSPGGGNRREAKSPAMTIISRWYSLGCECCCCYCCVYSSVFISSLYWFSQIPQFISKMMHSQIIRFVLLGCVLFCFWLTWESIDALWIHVNSRRSISCASTTTTTMTTTSDRMVVYLLTPFATLFFSLKTTKRSFALQYENLYTHTPTLAWPLWLAQRIFIK